MQQSLPSTVKVLGFALAVSFVTACAAYPPIAGAQGNLGTNIPVLVVGEDADPKSVGRSSDLLRRVITELSGAMLPKGFRMIDEESMAADLRWKIPDRRSKQQIIESIKVMTKSAKAPHQVRAWVLFRIYASVKPVGAGGAEVWTRISGEVYDAANNTLDSQFEIPREEYPAPLDCLTSDICVREVVGDRAREIAGSLGHELARRLAKYSPPKQSGSTRVGAGYGKPTTYTVTLRYFENKEAREIIRALTDDFPGFQSVELMKRSPGLRRYDYLTTMKATTLVEWLDGVLLHMGFDAEEHYLIQTQKTNIIVEKRP